MHNTYACGDQMVSNVLFSEGSHWSREVWVLRSRLDTLRDMCVKPHMAVDSHTQLRGLFSRTCNWIGFGEARCGMEKSLDLSMT
jgi:hypothetical protein